MKLSELSSSSSLKHTMPSPSPHLIPVPTTSHGVSDRTPQSYSHSNSNSNSQSHFRNSLQGGGNYGTTGTAVLAAGQSYLSQPKQLDDSNNVSYLNALSASQLFQEKLKNESQAYYQHKNMENKIRGDVGKTAEELMARTQLIESKYYSETKESSKILETTLAEINRKWESTLAAKQEEVDRYKQSLLEYEKNHEEELKTTKKSYEQLLEKKDSYWKSILIDVENKARRDMESLKDRVSLENDAKSMVGEAKCEAAESKAQLIFDKKLKKYEKQVAQVLERFEDRKRKYEGALEEVRRQLREGNELNEKKTTYLHEELVLKEKRITSMVGKIQQYNAMASEMKRWRDIAKELATMVANMSLQVADMPHEKTLSSNDSSASGANGEAIDDALRAFLLSKEKQAAQQGAQAELNRRLKEYKALRKTNVLISKKCLSKLDKCSKRIIEESEISKSHEDEVFAELDGKI